MDLIAGDKNEEQSPDPIRQCAVAVLVLLICGVFATQVGKIYVEPTDAGIGARGLPVFVLIAGGLLSVILLVLNLPDAIVMVRKLASRLAWQPLTRLVALALVAFGYIWAIRLFQYAIPTAVAMSAMLYLFGGRGWVRLAVIPVVSVAVYWFVFFVLLGMFEEPGQILQYDSYSLALRIRQSIGLQ
ncbi:tripartite tricarboxylate transporter TctB family protein [Pseudoruegeria sp. HB172150]|uniref:tripartite tricarboxylate transporter TctB family protein n=1 Tax=Pseudoruegeria sp. HB172150 TaxID=2721164 RepID=UPI0015540E99|nr:tripartite tricarboxylate transporter TctB family protein [Pseudoruegeria sp. HB172150]